MGHRVHYNAPNAPWRKRFLRELASCGNVSRVVDELGLVWSSVYQAKKQDPVFAAEWEEAMQAALDLIEARVVTRASNYSDRMAEFMLRQWRPAKYGDAPGQQASPPQVIINITERKDDKEPEPPCQTSP